MAGRRSARKRYWCRHLHEPIPCYAVYLNLPGGWWKFVVAGDHVLSMQRSEPAGYAHA